jgi:hypothetical protein
VLPHIQEAAAAQVEALLFESAPKKREARKAKRGPKRPSRADYEALAMSCAEQRCKCYPVLNGHTQNVTEPAVAREHPILRRRTPEKTGECHENP